jgi:hypothetical protein
MSDKLRVPSPTSSHASPRPQFLKDSMTPGNLSTALSRPPDKSGEGSASKSGDNGKSGGKCSASGGA